MGSAPSAGYPRALDPPMPKELALDFQTGDLIVTGAAGWLGVRFVDTLIHGLPDVPELATPAADARVRCLVLPGDDASALRRLSDRIDIVEGDVRDPSACARLFDGTRGSVLFHIAGIIHPRRVDEFYEINVEGTRRVLEAANAAGARRAVVMSSNSPCGTNPNRAHRFDENSPYHPYMNYGRSPFGNGRDCSHPRPVVLWSLSAAPADSVLEDDSGREGSDRRRRQQRPLDGLSR